MDLYPSLYSQCKDETTFSHYQINSVSDNSAHLRRCKVSVLVNNNYHIGNIFVLLMCRSVATLLRMARFWDVEICSRLLSTQITSMILS